MKFFSSTHEYKERWSTVTLAFFLRYPNPYASHVLSADVISRSITPSGILHTRRLILKRGAVPKWLPLGIVSRAESWIVEDSEVDPYGKVVRCETKNLDHVKILSVRETVILRESTSGSTLQRTEARVNSNFGWGLARRIERYGHEKFQRNLDRSRAGISHILTLLHQSRLQTLAYDDFGEPLSPLPVQGTVFDSFRPRVVQRVFTQDVENTSVNAETGELPEIDRPGRKWTRPRSWFGRCDPTKGE